MNAPTTNVFVIENLETRRLMSASGHEPTNMDSSERIGEATVVSTGDRRHVEYDRIVVTGVEAD